MERSSRRVLRRRASWRRSGEGLRRGQIFPLSFLLGLLGFMGARDHLVPGSSLRKLVAEHDHGQQLEERPTEFHVVAVDVLTGEELLLSTGPALDAVMANAAIPAVLPPVEWEGRQLMDGGVANNAPISHAVALGAREIYVLPTGHACALEQPPASALGMALHALSLLTHSRLIADVELHRDRAKLVVLPPPCPLAIQPIDFANADELIARSLSDARNPSMAVALSDHRSGRACAAPNSRGIVRTDPRASLTNRGDDQATAISID
jgi:NTE family protein